MRTYYVLCGIFLLAIFIIVDIIYFFREIGKQQKIIDGIFDNVINEKKQISRNEEVSINTILEIFTKIPENEKQLFENFLDKKTFSGKVSDEEKVLKDYFTMGEKFVFISLLFEKNIIGFFNYDLIIKDKRIFFYYQEIKNTIESAVLCGFDDILKYNYETYLEALIYLQNENRE
jgi:hypothetical protein